jgi:vacuolar-type H+-ATPase subunit E/Vma4
MSLINIIESIHHKEAELKEKLETEYQTKKNTISQNLEKEYLALKDEKMKVATKEADEFYQGRLMAFKLEERKKILSSKKAVIHSIIEKIKDSFKDLVGDQNYYQFLKDKALAFVEDGDSIILSKKDMTLKDSLISDTGKKNLTFSEGLFEGGIVIVKKNFNYNFSLESLIEDNFSKIEQIIGEKVHVLS